MLLRRSWASIDMRAFQIKERQKYAHCWGTGLYRQSPTSLAVVGTIATLGFKRVLDLGCGNAYVVRKLLDAGLDAYGVDITNQGWQTESRANPPLLVPTDRLIQAAVWDLPFEEKHFDLTFSITLLEHLPPESVARCISEILRVTKLETVHYIDVKYPQRQFGYNLHLTIRPVGWWAERFDALNDGGMRVVIKEKRGQFTRP